MRTTVLKKPRPQPSLDGKATVSVVIRRDLPQHVEPTVWAFSSRVQANLFAHKMVKGTTDIFTVTEVVIDSEAS